MTQEQQMVKKVDNYCGRFSHDMLDRVEAIIPEIGKDRYIIAGQIDIYNRDLTKKEKRSLANYRNQLKIAVCHPCIRLERPQLGTSPWFKQFVQEDTTKELVVFFRENKFKKKAMRELLPVTIEVYEEVPVYLECHGCKVLECKQKLTKLSGRKKRKKNPWKIIKRLTEKLEELEEARTREFILPESFFDDVMESVIEAIPGTNNSELQFNEEFND